MKNYKIAQMGLMIALAFILGYLESLFPLSLGIPGVKLGLANIVVLIAIVQFGTKDAMLLAFVRAVLTGFTFGNLYYMLYSLSGGLLSAFVMSLMHKTKKFSIIGISVTGGVMHNIGQLAVAMIVLKSLDLKYYLGFLTICGILTGVLTGIVSMTVLKSLKTK